MKILTSWKKKSHDIHSFKAVICLSYLKSMPSLEIPALTDFSPEAVKVLFWSRHFYSGKDKLFQQRNKVLHLQSEELCVFNNSNHQITLQHISKSINNWCSK